MTPEELADELGISGRTLRAWLRSKWPRTQSARSTRWSLTGQQITAARQHWPSKTAPSRSYWWSEEDAETNWVEVRYVAGIGTELRCGLVSKSGATVGAYELLDAVRPGDHVFHWHAHEHRFVGRSIAAGSVEIDRGERHIPLNDFRLLKHDVDLTSVRSHETALRGVRDTLESKYPAQTLYLPLQYRRDGLRMVNYYFAKLPSRMVEILGLEPQPGPSIAVTRGASAGAKGKRTPSPGFLRPFKAKADSTYVAQIGPRTEVRTRSHESLVKSFARWLSAKGHVVGYNRAIDLGIEEPPVIIEAKTIKASWSKATREAVGQLYEYRYRGVGPKTANLIFLASKEVPEWWIGYLETDRHIGVAWPDGKGFRTSKLATRYLRI